MHHGLPRFIHLERNKIDTVNTEAFSSSYNTLEGFYVSAIPTILPQPWPLPNMGSFTVLNEIFIVSIDVTSC